MYQQATVVGACGIGISNVVVGLINITWDRPRPFIDHGDQVTLLFYPPTDPSFPAGTNVELVEVESSTRIRILIWERGVGPTEASGTGACASAVAAAVHGGTSRDVDVVSPGGTQHVAWTDEGIRLTGWAEVVLVGRWHG